jgi:two-component system, OmpR family, phosphate regulon response regulator PhoB
MIMTDLDYQSRQQGRLLVVDDDEDVRHMLVRLLDSEGYQAAEAASGEEVLASLSTRAPDLVVLDIMLSSENGFDVLTAIRRQSEVPVILLTGRDRESDRVLGLRLGADDYVVKPFSPAELAARIATVLRRTGQRRAVAQNGPIDFGSLRIDTTSREVWMADELIETTAKEFDLLTFLASSPRQVFTREQLLAQVWGSSSAWQDAGTVTEHIRRIRRKIELDGAHEWIRTVRGVGYRFEPAA